MRPIKNKYRRWYLGLMEKAKTRGTIEDSEKHHIVPKSLGGKDNKTNIVPLTHREHFLAHWLLIKFTKGPERQKMLYALHCMRRSSKNHQRVVTGWRYEIVRRHNRDAALHSWNDADYQAKQTSSGKAAWARPGYKEQMIAQRRSPEARKKMSQAVKRSHNRPEVRALLSERMKQLRAEKPELWRK